MESPYVIINQTTQINMCKEKMLEDKITFLAGTNNSGKTSIIELMNRSYKYICEYTDINKIKKNLLAYKLFLCELL